MAAALFNTADLARYKQLEAQLADYRAHQVEENSSAATQQVRELEAALAREQAALHQIKGAEAAAAAEVDKQSHFHLGKLFRSEAANQKKKAAAEASLSDLQARRAVEQSPSCRAGWSRRVRWRLPGRPSRARCRGWKECRWSWWTPCLRSRTGRRRQRLRPRRRPSPTCSARGTRARSMARPTRAQSSSCRQLTLGWPRRSSTWAPHSSSDE